MFQAILSKPPVLHQQMILSHKVKKNRPLILQKVKIFLITSTGAQPDTH
jgi:hypothetical protein